MSVAVVVSPSDTHQSLISDIVGGAAIFFAIYLLLPGLHALVFTKRDALRAAPAFWIHLAALAMLLLGISWGQCETGTGVPGSWAAYEFLFLVLRLLVLAGTHEVVAMARRRSAPNEAGAFCPDPTKRLVMLIGILCLSTLLVIVPALTLDGTNHASGQYAQCVLFGAAEAQRWLALVYAAIVGLLGTYLIAALEKEHFRIRIPHNISVPASALGLLSASVSDPGATTAQQPPQKKKKKKTGMSDKFKLEVILSLIVADCVLTMWECFEIMELGDKPTIAASNLVYVLELTTRGMVCALLFLFYGFGRTIAGQFFDRFYGALACAASALMSCGGEATEASKLMESDEGFANELRPISATGLPNGDRSRRQSGTNPAYAVEGS